MKSLQLRRHRQIAEPRKYCLVRVIVFHWRVFSLFFVSHRLGIRVNSLQYLKIFGFLLDISFFKIKTKEKKKKKNQA